MSTNISKPQLNNQQKFVFDLLNKYHKYFSDKDKRYRIIVQLFRIFTLLFAMLATIVLGLSGIFTEVIQKNIGLVLTALITFLTGISSFLNLERYWIRNIAIHIDLNILRDSFLFDLNLNNLGKQKLEYYLKQIELMQKKNIKYWKRAIKNI